MTDFECKVMAGLLYVAILTQGLAVVGGTDVMLFPPAWFGIWVLNRHASEWTARRRGPRDVNEGGDDGTVQP